MTYGPPPPGHHQPVPPQPRRTPDPAGAVRSTGVFAIVMGVPFTVDAVLPIVRVDLFGYLGLGAKPLISALLVIGGILLLQRNAAGRVLAVVGASSGVGIALWQATELGLMADRDSDFLVGAGAAATIAIATLVLLILLLRASVGVGLSGSIQQPNPHAHQPYPPQQYPQQRYPQKFPQQQFPQQQLPQQQFPQQQYPPNG